MSSAQSNSAGQGDQGRGDGGDQPQRVPRRTPMACQFCRGRKLKCDGRPICGNCSRRNIACVYTPVSAQNS